MWPSYEGANDWKIVALMPKTEADKKVVRESLCCVLNALVACMSLMMREGHIGAVSTTDEEAMGYYLVKWLSKPYTLQEDTEGMSGMIPVGSMVVDGLYFNRVKRAPLWYTPFGNTTVVEVKYVLQLACNCSQSAQQMPYQMHAQGLRQCGRRLSRNQLWTTR